MASLERGKLVKLVELNYLSAFEIWPKIRDGFFIDFMQASECFLTTIQEQVTIQWDDNYVSFLLDEHAKL